MAQDELARHEQPDVVAARAMLAADGDAGDAAAGRAEAKAVGAALGARVGRKLAEQEAA